MTKIERDGFVNYTLVEIVGESACKMQIKPSGSGIVADIIHVLTVNICLWGNFVATAPPR